MLQDDALEVIVILTVHLPAKAREHEEVDVLSRGFLGRTRGQG
jgi:hypothetical protein